MKCVECLESEVSLAECVESRVIGQFLRVFGSLSQIHPCLSSASDLAVRERTYGASSICQAEKVASS